MKKRILSIISSIAILGILISASVTDVQASDTDEKKVDGSYLTTDESSTGHTSSTTRGQYLMTGECSITKAGNTRVYAYGSTTANFEVNYIATIVYVERYLEDLDEWGHVTAWMEDVENDFFLSTAKTIKVDRGYYYRVVANHLAGDEYPYEETASFTNGILVP